MIFRTEDDLDLRAISESGQTFRWEDLGGGSWRIFSAADCLYVRELGDGRFDLDCGEEEFRSVWHDYFDLSEDYASLREKIDPTEDLFLYEAARYGKGIRILRQDPWEMLISFILSQNRNIPMIRKSIALLAQACGERKTDSRGEEYNAFPTPEALAFLGEDRLRACGLGYRCGYVRAAAAAVLEGRVDPYALTDADEETAREALLSVRGVGEKVAACVSLFGLHHTNAFPKDVWINRVLAEHYPEGYPFERYSPWNGLYQQYLFAYARTLQTGD